MTELRGLREHVEALRQSSPYLSDLGEIWSATNRQGSLPVYCENRYLVLLGSGVHLPGFINHFIQQCLSTEQNTTVVETLSTTHNPEMLFKTHLIASLFSLIALTLTS
jgi:hypothetical protein